MGWLCQPQSIVRPQAGFIAVTEKQFGIHSGALSIPCSDTCCAGSRFGGWQDGTSEEKAVFVRTRMR